MRNKKIHRLVAGALLAALICATTALLKIPSPLGGYCNLGDALVLLGGFLLGPVWGSAAGALGSALADLLLGYALYAPATFVIKGLMALVGSLLLRGLAKRPWLGTLLGSLAGEILMLGGYFLFELPQYGLATTLRNLLAVNLPQAILGLVGSAVLFGALKGLRRTID